jgi:hypothetical protein
MAPFYKTLDGKSFQPAGHAGGFLLAQLSLHRSTATIVFPKESETWRQVL